MISGREVVFIGEGLEDREEGACGLRDQES